MNICCRKTKLIEWKQLNPFFPLIVIRQFSNFYYWTLSMAFNSTLGVLNSRFVSNIYQTIQLNQLFVRTHNGIVVCTKYRISPPPPPPKLCKEIVCERLCLYDFFFRCVGVKRNILNVAINLTSNVDFHSDQHTFCFVF